MLEICILQDQSVIKNRSDDVINQQGPTVRPPSRLVLVATAVNGLTLSCFMEVKFHAHVNYFHIILLCRSCVPKVWNYS